MARIQKIEMEEERRLLATLITNTQFLDSIRELVNPKLFETSFAQTVASWVIEYHSITKKAPGMEIEQIYLRKKRGVSADDCDLIQDFLQTLSKDWNRWATASAAYSTVMATEFFKLRSLALLSEELSAFLARKDYTSAERAVSQYKRVEKLHGSGISLLRDSAAIARAFTREWEMLFSLPGALGRSLGPLCRGDFLGIQAPPKRGKSWWLWFIAYRASRLGLKVVFFNLEMTEEQMLRRSWCCYTGKPEKAGKLQMPYFDDNGSVSSSPKEFSAAFSSKEAVEASQRKFRMLTRGGDVRIEFFPSDSLTVGQIETQLQNLEEYENFVPDVVVVDYADLLLADDTRLEYRHRLDSIWKKLRGLAQLRGCLVATATQGGIRKVESDKIVGVGDVAEDARKLAHVTKFITLNQTKDDKKKGVMRVSTSLQREAFGEDSGKDVIVLQNLSIGRPYIDSRLREDTEYADESTYNKKSHTHKEE